MLYLWLEYLFQLSAVRTPEGGNGQTAALGQLGALAV